MNEKTDYQNSIRLFAKLMKILKASFIEVKKPAGYLPENIPRWVVLPSLNTQQLQKAISQLP